MADWKILGGTNPPIQSLGKMTQGLGYPLRDVEPATSGGEVTVRDEVSLTAESFNQQEPSGLGVALQIEFGDAQATDQFDLSADGAITCLVTDEYECAITFCVGRQSPQGSAQIYVRALVNGVQFGSSRHCILDDAAFEIPIEFNLQLDLTAGDIVTFEVIRDTDGANDGGLQPGIPDIPWNPSPSAYIQLSRTLAVQT